MIYFDRIAQDEQKKLGKVNGSSRTCDSALADNNSLAVKGSPTKSRGAVLLEFALVLLILIPLLAFIFDYGRGFNAARQNAAAARLGASTGAWRLSDKAADYHVLASVKNRLSDHTITQVSIYLVEEGSDGSPPFGCGEGDTTGIAGVCNIYNGTDVDNYLVTGGAVACNDGGKDALWCPKDRTRANIEGSGSPPPQRYIGVAVWSKSEPLIGLTASSSFEHYDYSVFPLIYGP